MSTPLTVTFSISPLMSTLPSSTPRSTDPLSATPRNRLPLRLTARNSEPLRSTRSNREPVRSSPVKSAMTRRYARQTRFGRHVDRPGEPKPMAEAMPRGPAAPIAMITATVACQRSWRRPVLCHPVVFSTARAASPGMNICICDGGCMCGGQLEELCGPAEGLSDGVVRQVSLVGPESRYIPRLPAWWERPECRVRQWLPCPARDTPLAAVWTGSAGLDELAQVGFVADAVPDEAQSCQGSLDQPSLRRSLACHHVVVDVWVMADQRGVDDGDPPHRLTNHRERPRPVRRADPGKPSGRVTHRGDGPHQRARPGLHIAHMFAVPCGPAGGGAEPGMLAARRERGAALLTAPDISHRVILCVAWAMPDPAVWEPR